MARPKDERLEAQRKQEILAAAKRCFSRNGFHQTSMREIVKESGLSTGAVYNYFDSKAAVVEAIAVEEREAFSYVIANLANAKDVASGVAKLVFDGLYYTSVEDARLGCEIYAEACRNEQVRTALLKNEQPFVDAIRQAIERGQKEGSIRKDIASEQLCYAVVTLFDGYSGRMAFDAAKPKQIANQARQIVLALLKG